MKKGSWKIWLGLAVVIIGGGLALLGVVFLGIGGVKFGASGPGGTSSTGSVEQLVSTDIPAPLVQVFNEVGAKIGTPPALLAAFMKIECRRLIEPFSGKLVTIAQITQWVQNDSDITDPPECAKTNGSNVLGPMQFQAGSIYLRQKGYEVKKDNPKIGTWEGYIQKVKDIRGKDPSILNIRDSVYAAAYKLSGTKEALAKTAEFKDAGWDNELLIKAVAIAYCHGHYGSDTRDDHITSGCVGNVLNGKMMGYGETVVYHYKNYKKQL